MIASSANNCTFTCLHCHWEAIVVQHKDFACLNFIKNHMLLHCDVTLDTDTSQTPSSSKWNSRNYRTKRKLLKESLKSGQTKITEYFDVEHLSSSIDDVVFIRKTVNQSIGQGETVSVKPILQLLYSNALKNTSKKSKNACRHDKSIKMFGAYLFCLIGRAGYEFLLENMGVALPSLSTILRILNEFPRIKEGEYLPGVP